MVSNLNVQNNRGELKIEDIPKNKKLEEKKQDKKTISKNQKKTENDKQECIILMNYVDKKGNSKNHAIFGDTFFIKEGLINIGCKFGKFLTFIDKTKPGYIFSKDKLEKVEEFLKSCKNVSYSMTDNPNYKEEKEEKGKNRFSQMTFADLKKKIQEYIENNEGVTDNHYFDIDDSQFVDIDSEEFNEYTFYNIKSLRLTGLQSESLKYFAKNNKLNLLSFKVEREDNEEEEEEDKPKKKLYKKEKESNDDEEEEEDKPKKKIYKKEKESNDEEEEEDKPKKKLYKKEKESNDEEEDKPKKKLYKKEKESNDEEEDKPKKKLYKKEKESNDEEEDKPKKKLVKKEKKLELELNKWKNYWVKNNKYVFMEINKKWYVIGKQNTKSKEKELDSLDFLEKDDKKKCQELGYNIISSFVIDDAVK